MKLDNEEIWLEPVILTGQHARLELLQVEHYDDLVEAVKDGELWKLWYTFVPKPEDMKKEIDRRLKLFEKKSMLPFSVIDLKTNKAIGMTTFLNIDSENKRVEIGGTWYRKSAQRTAINTECKYLLLTHAFEVKKAIAVEFRTHVANLASRKAIERLGAKFDGVLRNHMILPNGELRDTAVYSILPNEWEEIKEIKQWKKL